MSLLAGDQRLTKSAAYEGWRVVPKANHWVSSKQGDTSTASALMDAQAQVLFELASDGLLLVQTARQEIVAANASACAGLGYSRQELCHQPLSVLLGSQGVTAGESHRVSLGTALAAIMVKELSALGLQRKDGTIWLVQVTICDEFLPGHQLWQFRSHSTSPQASMPDTPSASGVNESLKQRYEDLLHSLDGIVWEFDLTRECFTFVSQKLEKLLGYTPEQWLADASLWQNSIHPDDREAAVHTCFSRCQTEDDFHFEYRMITVTGQVVWIRDFVTVVREHQQPVKLCGVLVDISDRKEVEEDLQASQRLNQQILDISPDILYLYDIPGRQLTYVNQRVTELMGYLPEELEQLDAAGLLDLIHPADRDRLVATLQQFATLGPETPLEPDTILETEFRFLRSDGEWRWLHSCQSLLMTDAAHQPLILFGTLQDIHDRKLAEKSLRDSERQFRTLTEAMPAAVFIFRETEILYVNSGATVITGYDREQLLNLSLDALLHPDFRQCFWDRHRSCAAAQWSNLNAPTTATGQEHVAAAPEEASGATLRQRGQLKPSPLSPTGPTTAGHLHPLVSPITPQIEIKILTQTGEERWLAFCDRRIEFEGQPATLGIALDISDRKQAEIALQAREAQIRLITDSVPCLIAYVDAHQRYQFVNQQYAHWFGRDRDHILGRHMRTLLKPTHYRQVQTQVKKVLSGQAVDFEAVLQDTHQQDHAVHISYVPHQDTTGEVLGFYVLIEDVTTLKRSESRLRESEARYRSVIEAISEGIILQQADGTIIACNSAAEEILGYSAEQMLGKTAIDPMWWTIHEDGTPFLAQDYPTTVTLRTGQPQSQVVMGIYRPDGHLRWLSVNSQPIFQAESDTPHAVVVSFSDITERRAAEQHLRQQELRLRLALEAAAMGTWELLAPNAPWTLCSERTYSIYGIPTDQDPVPAAVLRERIHPDDRERVMQAIATSFAQQTPWHLEYRLQHPDGQEHWVATWATVFINDTDGTPQMAGIVRDITQQKQAEAALRYQGEQEYLMRLMTQHIHQSLKLDEILNTAVAEVRQFLQVDRVLIYQLHPRSVNEAIPAGYDVAVRAESAAPGCLSMQGWLLRDPWLQSEAVLADLQAGTPVTAGDLQIPELSPSAQDFLEFFNIRAILMVPISHGDNLWGVLVAHQCHTPQPWHPIGINLLLQLVVQISIAIQQAELYQTVQQLNQNLEQQVQERTAQLEQMLDFEALLQRITDKVRESIDEDQILQTAVQELALGLNLACCDTGIYNPEQTISTIRHEYTQHLPPARGTVIPLMASPDPAVYTQLLRGQPCQFCFVVSGFVRPVRYQYVILACPIVDDQGVIGDLWLFKRQPRTFSDQEIRLVQQVANHCAIGIRQARLYQAAQSQVVELARLNRLKDDFLSTISHELRTPLSNMNNAIQMLELFLSQPNLFQAEAETTLRLKPSRASSYLQILRHQYQEELDLVNDLLDLSRLESGRVTLDLAPLDLRTWLPCVLELFDDRMRSHDQRLQIEIDPHLPTVISDHAYLEHILKELLNNACKYTPAGEEIRVQLRAKSPHVYLIVTNTGVTVPAEEIPHLFEKFYRVPTADPWKYGGTGLGLALVEQRVKQLGGRIWAESQPNLTRFIVELPQITTAHST